MFQLQGVNGERAADSAQQSRRVEARLSHAIPVSSPNDLRDGFFIRIRREQDEGHRDAPAQEFRYKADGFGVARRVLEEDEVVGLFSHHRLCIVDGTCVFQISFQCGAVSLQNFSDQEKVFFLVSNQ